jgi:hypothetical protein
VKKLTFSFTASSIVVAVRSAIRPNTQGVHTLNAETAADLKFDVENSILVVGQLKIFFMFLLGLHELQVKVGAGN